MHWAKLSLIGLGTGNAKGRERLTVGFGVCTHYTQRRSYFPIVQPLLFAHVQHCTDVGLSFIVRLLQALDYISRIIHNPCLEFSVLTVTPSPRILLTLADTV